MGATITGGPSLPNPMLFKGSIAVAADFPTAALVQTGWFYTITANVTDNDASKTNTGQSFLSGAEIAWNGTNWSDVGNTAIWTDDGTDIIPANSPRHLVLPSVNTPVTPTLAFGDGDSGFFEMNDDEIAVAIAGVNNIKITQTIYTA